MSFLTRDQLLKPAARRYANGSTSGGQTFRVRSLTEREQSEFEMGILDGKGQAKRERIARARRRLICFTLVGEDDQPLFSPNDEKSLAALAEQDGRLMLEIYEAAALHCGIKDSEIEANAAAGELLPADE